MDPELKDAKIDCTVGMINKIIHDDEDSKMLMALPKFMEILDPFKNDIEESTGKYHSEMKLKHREKKNTLIYCEQVLREAEKEAEKESIQLIDKFKNFRKHKMRALQTHARRDDDALIDKFERELIEEVERLEDELMGVEMKLSDALQQSTTDFQEKVKKIIEDMKTKTGAFIKEV